MEDALLWPREEQDYKIKKSDDTMPKIQNDEELKQILKKCGRSDEHIDGMMDFRKVIKSLKDDSDDDFKKVISEIQKKYEQTRG